MDAAPDNVDQSRLRFSPATAEQPAVVAVVAEIGVNHGGDPGTAKRLIDASAVAGADAVKFQYFKAGRLLSNQAELAAYQKGKAPSQHALLKELELPLDQLGELVAYAHDKGLAAVVTPFSPEDPGELAGLGLDAVKTASPDAVNRPLLEACAGVGLPMLVSTGTCGLEELCFAAELLRDHAAGGALLHCVSQYPTPSEQAQLAGIGVLIERFGLPVGYSDHTTGPETGGLAAAAGAVVIEKHITLDRDAVGPDHRSSIEPDAFAAYSAFVARAAAMLGVRDKRPADNERDVHRVSRQSVCAMRDLPAGHVLAGEDLTVKRPGTGLPAAELGSVVGRRLARAVSANDLLQTDDLAAD